jgi:hypothetical protein
MSCVECSVSTMHASWVKRVAVRLVNTSMIASMIACGSPTRTPLYAAGTDRDDGAGLLAQASARLTTDEEAASFGTPTRNPRAPDQYGGSEYGGDPYGGAMYGGDPYGGVSYANWQMPPLNYSAASRQTHYTPLTGLTGSIEGIVSWAGATPARVATACGTIENPTLRAGADKALHGVVVYIDKINVGRAMPPLPRPAAIGGVVAKRGCALVPAAQIVTSPPASLAIHGDATRARIRVTLANGIAKAYELQEGGLVELEVRTGVTKVDSEDNKIAAAWVIAIDSPYYALTDDTGRYRIDELAPGTYEVTFWQPPIATAGADGVLAYGAPIVARRSIRIEAAKPSQLSVSLR